MVQLPWKIIWTFLKKLKIILITFNSACSSNSAPGYRSEALRAASQRDFSSPPSVHSSPELEAAPSPCRGQGSQKRFTHGARHAQVNLCEVRPRTRGQSCKDTRVRLVWGTRNSQAEEQRTDWQLPGGKRGAELVCFASWKRSGALLHDSGDCRA